MLFLIAGLTVLLGFGEWLWAEAAAAEEVVEEIGLLETILGNTIIALFATIALGMAIGRIRISGISLGSSGVLFVALAVGAMGYSVPAVVGQVGLVLFVYCVGVAAGPSFFRAFAQRGKTLTILALLVVGSGALATIAMALLLDVPADLSVGIFAGALTSTPALAAGTEAIGNTGGAVSVGYGIAYPLGVVGVVLFVQLLPRLLRLDINQLASQEKSEKSGDEIVRTLIKITNPSLVGRRVREVDFIDSVKCRIVRQLDGERLRPISPDFRFQLDQVVLVISRARRVQAILDLLGEPSDAPAVMDTDSERRMIVVTSTRFVGQSIRDLDPLANFGVEISRFTRQGLSFVPPGDEKFQRGDLLTVVGHPENLQKFADAAGDRPQILDETDLISLAFGIALGVLLGITPFALPGSSAIKLGLAGGPLLIGLILAHFGKIGPIVGYLPRPSRLVVMEIGLVLFLAQAGTQAGGQVIPVLQQYGLSLLLMTCVVLIVPLVVAWIGARRLFGLSLLESLGGICGGMTSTPGLGAITAKTDADTPIISYAAAYPVALILMTLLAKLIVSALLT